LNKEEKLGEGWEKNCIINRYTLRHSTRSVKFIETKEIRCLKSACTTVAYENGATLVDLVKDGTKTTKSFLKAVIRDSS
jgi:bifunctional pyridoxal-dependent enzyme with beta-cystathionase and maltose regulon repressor activities